jgi:hypothetical protein
MNPDEFLKSKIAKALLGQHDVRKRNRQILIYVVALLALFAAHSYFTNLTTPLKLIPQTMTAMGMGYVLLCIQSLRRFGYVAEFMDWEKVRESADGAPK